MKYSKRAELFRKTKGEYAGLLASVLWKLTGDRELFAEAMQYSLLAMWRNVEKLKNDKAPGYIYRIALTANSKAWRNRVGRDGQLNKAQLGVENDPHDKLTSRESAERIRRAIAELPTKQAAAVVMRYFDRQSYEAIAEKLNCSQAGARSNVSKALAALKNKLSYLTE